MVNDNLTADPVSYDSAIFDGEWTVNGVEADEELSEELNDLGWFGRREGPECPLCHHQLLSRAFEDRTEGDAWHFERVHEALVCANCSHWEFNGIEGGNKCMDHQSGVRMSSISGRFEKDLPFGCCEELAKQLRRDPGRWHLLNPTKFEKLVAEVFRANYHDSEVFHVGRPGDGGTDVVFIDSNKKQWLIQAKCRQKAESTEGFATLQSILGTMVLEDSRRAIVVSTANKFSAMAEQKKAAASHLGYLVDFVDKGKLHRMLGPLLPNPPWKEIFSSPELGFLKDDVVRYFFDELQPELFDRC